MGVSGETVNSTSFSAIITQTGILQILAGGNITNNGVYNLTFGLSAITTTTTIITATTISTTTTTPAPQHTYITGANGEGAYVFSVRSPDAVTVYLSCIDSITTCDSTIFCLGLGCTPHIVYTTPFTIASQGNTYILYYSNDTLGNNETTQIALVVIGAGSNNGGGGGGGGGNNPTTTKTTTSMALTTTTVLIGASTITTTTTSTTTTIEEASGEWIKPGNIAGLISAIGGVIISVVVFLDRKKKNQGT